MEPIIFNLEWSYLDLLGDNKPSPWTVVDDVLFNNSVYTKNVNTDIYNWYEQKHKTHYTEKPSLTKTNLTNNTRLCLS